MPDEELKPETDGDKTTAYEDTEKHERTGLQLDKDDRIQQASEWDGIDL